MKRKDKRNKLAGLFYGTGGRRAKKKKRIVPQKTRAKNSVFRRKRQVKPAIFENIRKSNKERKHEERSFLKLEIIKIPSFRRI